MAARIQRKEKAKRQLDRTKTKRKAPVVIAVLIGFSIVIFADVMLLRDKITPRKSMPPSAEQQGTSLKSGSSGSPHDYQHLIGRWVRPDGDSVIEIRYTYDIQVVVPVVDEKTMAVEIPGG